MKTFATVVLAALLIAGCGGDVSSEDSQMPSPVSTPSETPSPAVTSSDTPTPAGEAPNPSLAITVETELLAANSVESFSELDASSPGMWITGIEDVSSGTIRVMFQTELNNDDRAQYGRWVAQMSCTSVADLKVVVVQDITGIDSNHYVADFPICS